MFQLTFSLAIGNRVELWSLEIPEDGACGHAVVPQHLSSFPAISAFRTLFFYLISNV
jgi:hypothetical protein